MLDPKGVRLTLLQPAAGLEALWLREDAGVPGHHIVAEHKLGLQRENKQAAHQLRAAGHPWEPQLSSPTHILGEKETADFNFVVQDDPRVDGDHGVETAGKRKCRPVCGSKEAQRNRPLDPTSPVPRVAPGPDLSPPAPPPTPVSALPHPQALCSWGQQPTAGSP